MIIILRIHQLDFNATADSQSLDSPFEIRRPQSDDTKDKKSLDGAS